ncbi:MAG: carboxypeptidase-like regulatory domain-containing protein, partial [Phycisphaerales bacterium]
YLRRLEQFPILCPESWLATRTDSQGGFRFESFAADVSADFHVEAPGRTLICTYTPHRMTVCGFEAGRVDVRLVLAEGTAVRGRVVAAGSGEPAAGARLIIQPDMIDAGHAHPYLPESTVSDRDGRFAFSDIPPGRHYIDVSAAYESGLADRRFRFEVQPGQGVPEITADLRGGGRIEIEAREERTNEPIRDLSVYFWEPAQDFFKDVQTDANGVLRIHAPVGSCEFSTSLDGYSPWSYKDHVLVTPDQTVRSRIILRRYPLVTGLVLDGAGRPVAGAAVNHSVTDEVGRFEAQLPSEDSMFSRWIARCERENLAAIAGLAYDEKPVRITLEPALAVSGRICDPNGVGIPAARVALHVRTSEGLTPYGPEVLTDSQGRYEMRAVVPVGGELEHRISVNASGYGIELYSRISIEGEPGTRVELAPIVLAPTEKELTGIVVDADGRPAAGTLILVRGANQPVRHTVTDGQGRFAVRRVCKGPLQIQAGTSGADKDGFLRAEGGDRDVKVILGRTGVHPRHASLVGEPLPIESLGLDMSHEDLKGKRILLCVFDWQQRPSRNLIVELRERAERLSLQNVAVVAVQVGQVDQAELDKWIADAGVAFPIHTVAADAEMMRLWGSRSLPWLILTDPTWVVVAEGPQLIQMNLPHRESDP